MRSRLPLTLCSIAVATTSALAAEAQIKLPPAEVVVDLGVYDAAVAAHAGYAIGTPTPPSANCPGENASYNWTRVWQKGADFGNSTFGGGYEAKVELKANSGVNAPDKFSAKGLLRAFGTIFDHDVTLFQAQGSGITGSPGTASATVTVLGQQIWSSGATSGTKTFTKTFFSHDQWITLGIVPVHFNATATGQLGYSYGLYANSSALALSFEPWGKAWATASASVDVWLASAGVTGTVELFQVNVPVSTSVGANAAGVTFSADADVEAKGLSGTIEAWAKVPGKKWTMKLASWPPLFEETFEIIDVDACIAPLLHSVCGNNTCEGNETHTNCSQDCDAPPPPPDDDDDDLPPICQIQPWKCPLDP